MSRNPTDDEAAMRLLLGGLGIPPENLSAVWTALRREVPHAASAIANLDPVLDLRGAGDALAADTGVIGFRVREHREYHIVLHRDDLNAQAPDWRASIDPANGPGDAPWNLLMMIQEDMTSSTLRFEAQWIAVVSVERGTPDPFETDDAPG